MTETPALPPPPPPPPAPPSAWPERIHGLLSYEGDKGTLDDQPIVARALPPRERLRRLEQFRDFLAGAGPAADAEADADDRRAEIATTPAPATAITLSAAQRFGPREAGSSDLRLVRGMREAASRSMASEQKPDVVEIRSLHALDNN